MKLENVTDETLLRAALQYQDALTVYAYSILGDWALAQDAMQEALMVVHKKWATFRPGSEVFPWLRQVVRLQALMSIRSRKRESVVEDETVINLIDREFDESMNDRAIEALRDRERALETCMGKLHVSARSLLMGFYRDRKPCETLAKEFGKSANAIRVSLSRIRDTLKRCVQSRLTVTGGAS